MDKKPKKPSTYTLLQELDKTVQNSKPKKESNSRSTQGTTRVRSPSPAEKHEAKKPKIQEIVIDDDVDYDIPDRSYGDLYCSACDSHMNSEQMWEAHIQGKRHIKHAKKKEPDHKYNIVLDEAIFQKEIEKSKEVIIGLKHCCELRRQEGKPTYQCFLCSAHLPNGPQLIEHAVGLKHRMAYLKEHDPEKFTLISKADLKKGMIEPVVEECIRQHQDKYGPGKMQVKIEKEKQPVSYPFPSKKPDDFYKKKKDDRRSNFSDDKYSKVNPNKVPLGPRDRDYSDSRSKSNSYGDSYYKSSKSSYDRYDDYSPRREIDKDYRGDDDDYPSRRPTDDYSLRKINDDYSLRKINDDYPSRKTNDNYPSHKTNDDYPSRRTNDSYLSQRSDDGYLPRHDHEDYQSIGDRRSSYFDNELDKPQPIMKRNYDHKTSSITVDSKSEIPKAKDLRDVLVQRKQQEVSSQVDFYNSIINLVNTIPDTMFYQIGLNRLEQNTNPTSDELDAMQKLASKLLNYVQKHKIQKLSPDLINHFQQTVGNSAPSELYRPKGSGFNQTNNFSSLLEMIDQYKTKPIGSEAQAKYMMSQSASYRASSTVNEPDFMAHSTGKTFSNSPFPSPQSTGKTFSNSPFPSLQNTTSIPGLTLSGESENKLMDFSYLLGKTETTIARASTSSWPEKMSRY